MDDEPTYEELLNTPLGLLMFALGQELVKADQLPEGTGKIARFTEIDDVYKSLVRLWPDGTNRVCEAMQELITDQKMIPSVRKWAVGTVKVDSPWFSNTRH